MCTMSRPSSSGCPSDTNGASRICWMCSFGTACANRSGDRRHESRDERARTLDMNATVLVVEDDRDSRELLGEMLELSGYRPLLAADGLEALRLLRRERPCVILLD